MLFVTMASGWATLIGLGVVRAALLHDLLLHELPARDRL
jgi:hypothetical protein